MTSPLFAPRGRYWVLGGRWADEGRLPWPRAIGPFPDLEAARETADTLNALGEADARYVIVADVPEGATACAPGAGLTARSDLRPHAP